MANIKRVDGKTGISYKITVTYGRDMSGKQIRHYKTWRPDAKMTERQMEKEIQRLAIEFEQQIKKGFLLDEKQTFSEYAEYFIELKIREGRKRATIASYKDLLSRINLAIGHLKLSDIRPQHLNSFYSNLAEEGISKRRRKVIAKPNLKKAIDDCGMSKKALASNAKIGQATLKAAYDGKRISLASAEAISKSLNIKTEKLFSIAPDNTTLSPKSIREHHRLISSILSQAEKEMLIPYNAASKATPPSVEHKTPNYFQLQDVERIRDALDKEPLKWKVITHLFLITGCRRGEVAGLKWSKVDFDNSKLTIDHALYYLSGVGIYADTTKTNKTRFIKLPVETIILLKQYRIWYKELKEKNGDRWNDTDYLFVTDDGSPLHPDSISKWMVKFSKRHNLPHINPHAFRHTMASILINKGADIVSVSKRLGHSRVSTTTDYYAQIIEEADADAADSLADVIFSRDKVIKNGVIRQQKIG